MTVSLPFASVKERISLARLADRERVSPVSTWRWSRKGIHNVVLPTFCIGRKRYTTHQAFENWCRQVTEVANREAMPSTPADSGRVGAIDRADSEADQLLGIGTAPKRQIVTGTRGDDGGIEQVRRNRADDDAGETGVIYET